MEHNIFFSRSIMRILGILLIVFMVLLIMNEFKTMRGPSQKMQISATGEVIATPDLAIATIGVSSQGFTPTEVKNSNNQKMNQVIAFIKQQDIDAKDIKTSGFYSSPRYNYANGQNTIIGYQADQTITVTFRGVDESKGKLQKILDGVVGQGANQIQGVNFSFSDIDKWKNLARKQAIEKAKGKAKQLASETNLHVVKIINVVESPNEFVQPRMNVAQFAAKAQSQPVAPNIEVGTQEITETVQLIFEVY